MIQEGEGGEGNERAKKVYLPPNTPRLKKIMNRELFRISITF